MCSAPSLANSKRHIDVNDRNKGDVEIEDRRTRVVKFVILCLRERNVIFLVLIDASNISESMRQYEA